MTDYTGPLSRFTVLDLTRVRSGPTAVRQLADWGADVIKIEAPLAVDTGKGMGGARSGPDFQSIHRNKRSMTLNLKEPAAKDIFMKMVADADVVVENFRPDVKGRLGIAYEDLKAVNKGIVFRLRSRWSVCAPPGLRPDCTGHGRLDVDHRCTGPRADACRHPGCGFDRRHVRRHWRFDRVVGA